MGFFADLVLAAAKLGRIVPISAEGSVRLRTLKLSGRLSVLGLALVKHLALCVLIVGLS